MLSEVSSTGIPDLAKILRSKALVQPFKSYHCSCCIQKLREKEKIYAEFPWRRFLPRIES